MTDACIEKLNKGLQIKEMPETRWNYWSIITACNILSINHQNPNTHLTQTELNRKLYKTFAFCHATISMGLIDQYYLLIVDFSEMVGTCINLIKRWNT